MGKIMENCRHMSPPLLQAKHLVTSAMSCVIFLTLYYLVAFLSVDYYLSRSVFESGSQNFIKCLNHQLDSMDHSRTISSLNS